MSANMKERRASARRMNTEFRATRVAVERRRAPSRAAVGEASDSSASPITLSVMRAMVAAADALRAHAENHGTGALSAPTGSRARIELATKIRWYQAASRNFIKDWLHNVARTSWLVDAATGRSLRPAGALPAASAPGDPDCLVALAEDQALHGLRERFTREGVGIPVVVRKRAPEQNPDELGATAAAPCTAVVSVEADVDRRVRTVRVRLRDPAVVAAVELGGIEFPLAADFTAPLAQTLGLGRKPAAVAYGIRDATRRGSIEGFTPLTPFAPGLAPLVLMEGAGLSPLMVSQIANDAAGDAALRDRYQVWLYRYATTTPLLFAAYELRADLARFYARLDATGGGATAAQGVIVAHGVGAVLAESLLGASGTAIWDAVFTTPLPKIDMLAADRARLDALFFWQRSARIERVVHLAESGPADALTTGVGDRALRLLQRQSPDFRLTVERIYRTLKRQLRPQLHVIDTLAAPGRGATPADPVCDALAAAAVAADRALLARVAATRTTERQDDALRSSAGLRASASGAARLQAAR